jgi:hypothetical protein
MTNKAEKILFLKPFEIDSSNISLRSVWKSISRILRNTEGAHESGLFCSIYNSSKYGFVSYSAWDSRESFMEAAKENIVLRYHISKNGDSGKSYSKFLYKVIDREKAKGKSAGTELFIILFIKKDKSNESDIKLFWESIKDNLIDINLARDIYLCKSIHQKANYNYIVFGKIKIESKDIKDINSFIDDSKYKNISIKDYHFSIYNKNNLKVSLN